MHPCKAFAKQQCSTCNIKEEPQGRGTAEVTLMTEKLGEGGEGSVYKVSWRNGTYARKLFDGGTFNTEDPASSYSSSFWTHLR